MDKRRKVLVVEDDEVFRQALAAALTAADFHVYTCGSLGEARGLLKRISFDVALIDISLNGPLDMSNRDGLQVLTALRESGEGTTALVLTGHEDSDLMRTVWKDFGGDDYISKGSLERKGVDYLIKAMRNALKSRPPGGRTVSWHLLVSVLSPDRGEADFVHALLRDISFKGGLPTLQAALQDATKWLHPLLPATRAAPPARALAGVFSGTCWSKGQGTAVEIILHGREADVAALAEHAAGRGREELHRRAKGGLTALVLARPDLARSSFADGQ